MGLIIFILQSTAYDSNLCNEDTWKYTSREKWTTYWDVIKIDWNDSVSEGGSNDAGRSYWACRSLPLLVEGYHDRIFHYTWLGRVLSWVYGQFQGYWASLTRKRHEGMSWLLLSTWMNCARRQSVGVDSWIKPWQDLYSFLTKPLKSGSCISCDSLCNGSCYSGRRESTTCRS